MARLPIPGSDDGQWGDILNEYLSQVHTPDGSLKSDVIDEAVLAPDVVSKLNVVAGQQGATGATGPAGATGSAGPAGATGAAGATGPAGVTNIVAVLVTTGSEARPTATTVMWVGGSVQPTNMGTNDLWFSQDPPADTTPPSAPTNLAATNITSNSFTLTWDASTDNVGVTAYELFINNISHSIVTSTSVNVTGRAGNTTYACKVRARDSAGNWGPFTASIDATTEESSTADHSVYGDAPQPGLLAFYDGGTIIPATGFRVLADGWSVKGARLYVPSGQALPPTCTAYLYAPAFGSAPDLSSPVASATMAVVAGGWNEAEFLGPTPIANGTPFWIGYDFGDGAYLSSTSVGSSAVQANDGSDLYMLPDSLGSVRRQYFRLNGNDTASTVPGQTYGIDVIATGA